MPRGVIFDLDGVLIDSFHAHFESWKGVAAEHGVALTEQEFARTFGRTSREIIVSTWAVPDLTDERVREIDDRKETRYREIIAHHLPIMEGALVLIDALRAAGFRIAVGSSAPPENVRLAIDRIGPHRFDAAVHGRDVHRGKPQAGRRDPRGDGPALGRGEGPRARLAARIGSVTSRLALRASNPFRSPRDCRPCRKAFQHDRAATPSGRGSGSPHVRS